MPTDLVSCQKLPNNNCLKYMFPKIVFLVVCVMNTTSRKQFRAAMTLQAANLKFCLDGTCCHSSM